MKKILLLTTIILLSSVSVYAVCNPNLPACQCSYPKMVNGIIGCSESYCEAGTNCMADGSCCPEANYCESIEKEKQCCSDDQTCDTTKGCVEKKANIETLCAGKGTLETVLNRTFCVKKENFTWYEAKEWCENNGMTMASMYDMCPDWSGGVEEDGPCGGNVEVWSASTCDARDGEGAFQLIGEIGYIRCVNRQTYKSYASCY